MEVKFTYHKMNCFKEKEQWYLVHSQCCATTTHSKIFLSPQRETPNALNSHPTIYLPPAPGMCVCAKLRKRFGVGRKIGESVGRCECGRESVERE